MRKAKNKLFFKGRANQLQTYGTSISTVSTSLQMHSVPCVLITLTDLVKRLSMQLVLHHCPYHNREFLFTSRVCIFSNKPHTVIFNDMLLDGADGDKSGRDTGPQGFRAWVPPAETQQQVSRKRSLPNPHDDPKLADHGQTMQGSAMHRPGGSALHSRTKQQCLRSGQNKASHSNGTPAWDPGAAFPSYTQLAREQVITAVLVPCLQTHHLGIEI